MHKTLFFDLGNVLLFFDHQKMICQLAKYCNLDISLIEEIVRRYGTDYERGTITSDAIFKELVSLSKKTLDFSSVMEAMGNIFQPNLPVIELAMALKQKGHPLFLLSNTCEAHFRYAIKHYPFLKGFDGYVLSFEVKALKPEKKIYEKALELAGCRSEGCFYVDDIPEYVQAAKNLCIDAERYTTVEQLATHFSKRGML